MLIICSGNYTNMHLRKMFCFKLIYYELNISVSLKWNEKVSRIFWYISISIAVFYSTTEFITIFNNKTNKSKHNGAKKNT